MPTPRKPTVDHRAAANARGVVNSHGDAGADIDFDAEIAKIEAEEENDAAAMRAQIAQETAALAALAEERDRPAILRRGRLAELRASKADAEAKAHALALVQAHEAADSVQDAAFANAAAAREAATFGGNPDFAAVTARQLGDVLGVEIPAAVFTRSGDAGVVCSSIWGLGWVAKVSRDTAADVWTAEISASTYAPDGITVRHTGSITSALDLALLLAGSPRVN